MVCPQVGWLRLWSFKGELWAKRMKDFLKTVWWCQNWSSYSPQRHAYHSRELERGTYDDQHLALNVRFVPTVRIDTVSTRCRSYVVTSESTSWGWGWKWRSVEIRRGRLSRLECLVSAFFAPVIDVRSDHHLSFRWTHTALWPAILPEFSPSCGAFRPFDRPLCGLRFHKCD